MERQLLKGITTSSRLILETNENLEKTFNDLLRLKEIGIADYKTLILHNEGELLPAGVYDDYESFNKCFMALSAIKPGDIDSLNDVNMIIAKSIANKTEKEKIQAISYWEIILKKYFERTSNKRH